MPSKGECWANFNKTAARLAHEQWKRRCAEAVAKVEAGELGPNDLTAEEWGYREALKAPDWTEEDLQRIAGILGLRLVPLEESNEPEDR